MRYFLIKYFIRAVVKLISAQTRIRPRMCIMYKTVSLRPYVKPFNIIKVPKENTMKHFGRIVTVNHGWMD